MKLARILPGILTGAIFLILFTPLIVSDNMFFPYITGKNFFFRIVVEFLVAGWLILAYLNPTYRLKKTSLVIAATIFVAVIALADVLGKAPYVSFWSNYERMEGLIGLLHVYGYFLVATTLFRSQKIWTRFFQTSLGVSVIIGIYGLGQLAGKVAISQSSTRIDATFGNAAYLAVYALVHAFLAAFLFSRTEAKEKLLRWAYVAIAALNLVVLYGTATRGTILGLIGGVLLTTILIALFEKSRPKLKKWAMGTILIVVAVIGLFFVFKDSAFVQHNEVLKRFADISVTEQTTKSRFMVWGMAWQGFKEHPVLGWGQENFLYVFSKYYNPGMYSQEPWFDRAHNVFLDWLIAGGALGLLGYLSLFVLALVIIWREERFSVTTKSILTGLLGGYFFHNLFVFDQLISYISFFSLLAYFGWLGRGEDEPVNMQTSGQGTMALLVIGATITVLVGSLYYLNYKPIAANQDLIQAIKPQGDPAVNLSYFKKTIGYNTFGNAEAREQLGRISLVIARSTQVSQELKDQFVNYAVGQQQKEVELFPNNARHMVFLGNLFYSLAQYDNALTAYQKARQLSPKKQDILLQLGATLTVQKKYDEALAVLKEAYDLAPEYREAQVNYALGAIYAGKDALAQSIIGDTPIVDQRFVGAYAARNQYNKVIEILNLLIAQDPGNTQYHLSLAAAYVEVGQRAKAIEIIQKEIDKNPDFKDQGNYYINEIRAGRNP